MGLRSLIDKGKVWPCLILAIVLVWGGNSIAGISAQADFLYQKTKTRSGGKTTETTTKDQIYAIGFDKALTSTIFLSGDLRYRITETDGKRSEDAFPLLYLTYNPPAIYNISFSYSRTESAPGGERLTTTNTNASFNLPQKRWPSLLLTYNRSTSQDHLTPHKKDTLSTDIGATTTYTFKPFDTDTTLSYTIKRSTSEDRVGQTKTEIPEHLATAAFSRSFWDKRVSADANIGYNRQELTYETLGAPKRFEVEITPEQGLYGVDSTPSSGSLSSTPSLIDNNRFGSTGIDLNGDDRNIGLKFTKAEKIHKLYLYISTSDPQIGVYNFNWEIYYSSDGVSWTSLSGSVSYESVNARFVFTFTETESRYFKVVNRSSPAGAQTINVTEIEGIGYLTETPTETVTNVITREFGGLSIGVKPVERLRLAYNLNYDHSTQDLNETESTLISHNTSMDLIIIPKYLHLTAGAALSTTSTDQRGLSTENETRSYSLTLSSTPLPTVRGNLSYGSSESLTNGATISTTDSVSANLSMTLYRGIDLGLGTSFSTSENPDTSTTTDTLTHSANLKLVPWKPLTIVTSGSISETTTKKPGEEKTSTSQGLSTTLSYTPTRNFYLSAVIVIEPSTSQSYSITWLPTSNIQVGMRYGLTRDTTTMGLDFNWTPVRRLVMTFNYSGTRVDNATKDRSDTIFARLSLRF